jgi:hypothetical protein
MGETEILKLTAAALMFGRDAFSDHRVGETPETGSVFA